MKTLTIRSVPDSIHIRVKAVAVSHNMPTRSVLIKMIQCALDDTEESWLTSKTSNDDEAQRLKEQKTTEEEEEQQDWDEDHDWGDQPVLSPEEKIAAITQAGYRREAAEKKGKKYLPSDQEIEAGYYEQFGEQRPNPKRKK